MFGAIALVILLMVDLPQIVKILRRRSSGDISGLRYVLLVVACGLLVAQAAVDGSRVLVVVQSWEVVVCSFMVWLVWRFRDGR